MVCVSWIDYRSCTIVCGSTGDKSQDSSKVFIHVGRPHMIQSIVMALVYTCVGVLDIPADVKTECKAFD